VRKILQIGKFRIRCTKDD